jgi:hypothetical protein
MPPCMVSNTSTRFLYNLEDFGIWSVEKEALNIELRTQQKKSI